MHAVVATAISQNDTRKDRDEGSYYNKFVPTTNGMQEECVCHVCVCVTIYTYNTGLIGSSRFECLLAVIALF